MLSDDDKREIKRLIAEQLRRNWGVVKARPLAAVVDDIRARFIEEGWFGKPLTEVSNAVQRMVAQHELYGRMEREEEELAKRGGVVEVGTDELSRRDEEERKREREAELE